MKKVNFFKVMSACVAFAAVTFTSCSEEEMTLTAPDVIIPEMPETPVIPATASVAVSVYSVSTSDAASNAVLLTVENIDATANIGKTMTVECPAIEGYIVAPATTVAIPQLNDGQAVVVPVAFYVASEGSAEEAIMQQFYDNAEKVEDIILIDKKENTKTITNELKRFTTIKAEKLEYFTGYEYVGETEKPESKAAASGYEFMESLFSKIAFVKEELGTKDEDGNEVREFFLNPYHQTTVTYEQPGETYVTEIEFNGSVYYVEFKKAGAAIWTMSKHTVMEKYTHEWAHIHTHGHAGHDWLHGNSNAGGGIVKGE